MPGSLDGISVSGSRTNVVIRSGTVRGWGSDGIQASTVFNGQFTDLRVSNNRANGLQGGNGGVIKSSSDNRIDSNHVSDNGIGIDGNPATGNVIIRNTASGNTTAYSIAVGNASGGVSATPATAGAWANLSF